MQNQHCPRSPPKNGSQSHKLQKILERRTKHSFTFSLQFHVRLINIISHFHVQLNNSSLLLGRTKCGYIDLRPRINQPMATESFQNHPGQSYSSSPPMTIILTILLLVFFFMGFFSLFLCRCFVENVLQLWYLLRGRTSTPVGPACHNNGGQGLDPSIIQSFPTFTYSCVKDLRKEEYGLECAICLGEFVDDDLLRLLRACYHVFHTECIDLWFESHTTCPVCRRVLDEIEKSPAPTNTAIVNETDGYARSEPIHEDTSSITIKVEDTNIDNNEKGGPAEQNDGRPNKVKYPKKFWKSHSTGHSMGGGNIRSDGEDRFTLRLPQHLHLKLVRGHQWTGSCTIFGEFKSKQSNGGDGAVIGDVSEFWGGDVNIV